MSKESIFLLLAAVGLAPIALSYGASPEASLSLLYDIDAGDVNSRHIFRAVMGLYLAQIVFWVCGARSDSLKLPALWSLTVFMLGLAAGRALSLMIDGMPHPLLAVFLVLEIGFGVVGFMMIRGYRNQ